MRYAAPGEPGSAVSFKPRYDHFIGGEYVRPAKGAYLTNPTPVTGEPFTEVARGTAEDVDRALDAARGAARAWGRTPAAERATVLNEVADRIEDHLEALAVAETWDNGKPIHETLTADLPLAVDHFRHFAGAVRTQEGGISRVDRDQVAYHFPEPLGVVGLLIPPDFPILAAARELAPALAAGNAVVLKPAEQTPASIHVLMGLIAELLPPGVVNIVTGNDPEAGRPLATSRLIAARAGENPIPVTPEPGGKSPTIFFEDVAAQRDAFYDRALEGFTTFALNQGETCTYPSKALVQSTIYDQFVADATTRTRAIRQGHPLDTETTIGAQVSQAQVDRFLTCVDIGKQEGARLLTGGAPSPNTPPGGYYVTPTIFEADNKMRIFQEETPGPLAAITPFNDFDDAIKLANDTTHRRGAGTWSRDGTVAHRAAREIQASHIRVNNHHPYPAHAAFSPHKTTLDRYQQTKSLLVSYATTAQGFF